MLGEGIRKGCRVFQGSEPVPICHQFLFLFSSQSKHEFFRKSFSVPSHLPVKILCFDAIEFSRVAVNHDFLASNVKDALLEECCRYNVGFSHIILPMEADLALRLLRRLHQLPDGFKDYPKLFIIFLLPTFEVPKWNFKDSNSLQPHGETEQRIRIASPADLMTSPKAGWRVGRYDSAGATSGVNSSSFG